MVWGSWAVRLGSLSGCWSCYLDNIRRCIPLELSRILCETDVLFNLLLLLRIHHLRLNRQQTVILQSLNHSRRLLLPLRPSLRRSQSPPPHPSQPHQQSY